MSLRLYDNKFEGEKGISQDEIQKLVLEYYKIKRWDVNGIPQKYKQAINKV